MGLRMSLTGLLKTSSKFKSFNWALDENDRITRAVNIVALNLLIIF